MLYSEIRPGYYWVKEGSEIRMAYVTEDADVQFMGTCQEKSLAEVLNYMEFLQPVHIPIEYYGWIK